MLLVSWSVAGCSFCQAAYRIANVNWVARVSGVLLFVASTLCLLCIVDMITPSTCGCHLLFSQQSPWNETSKCKISALWNFLRRVTPLTLLCHPMQKAQNTRIKSRCQREPNTEAPRVGYFARQNGYCARKKSFNLTWTLEPSIQKWIVCKTLLGI